MDMDMDDGIDESEKFRRKCMKGMDAISDPGRVDIARAFRMMGP